MDLSVIIVNYRGWEPLRECLGSLKLPEGVGFSYEIIVVDNNSDDGQLENFVKDYPYCQFIHNTVNGGFAYGCNKGAKVAHGDYLLFLNPDTVSIHGSIGRLMEEARLCKGMVLISCRQYSSSGRNTRAYGLFPGPGKLTGTGRAIYKFFCGEKVGSSSGEENEVIHPDWVSGSVMMISKESFSMIGGFDEDYWMYYEDTDICRRIRNNGGDIRYYTTFGIIHNHGGASRINIRTAALTKTEVNISRHVYVSKHFTGFTRFILQKYLVINNLITGLISALAGLVVFFRPGIFLFVLKFARLFRYYLGSAIYGKWISPRSVNFNNTQRSNLF